MANARVAARAVKSPLRVVRVRVKAEGAREVVVTGEFTGWSTDKVRLASGPPGEWYADLRLPPGDHQYRLLIDGEWRDDPEARSRVPNPFGCENCVLTVT